MSRESRALRHSARFSANRFGAQIASSGDGGQSVLPNISSISSGTPNATDATITWTTMIASSTEVEYGTTTAYGTIVANTTPVLSHSIQLTSLITATLYHYRVISRLPDNRSVYSDDQTFTTA